MYFNSLDFAIFLPLVFAGYWLIGSKNTRSQNVLLVAASYVFYGWWDWRFLSLILLSTVIDFIAGRGIAGANKPITRKIYLGISIGVNLGLLCFFKYFNFFVDNFSQAFTLFGGELHVRAISIVLPVGISFYTFQTLSYSIDVYWKHIPATKNFIAFAAYVSFFPQLVAGPIERAKNFLPQFSTQRKFEYNAAVDGMRQILWGLFKKMVIADNCASYVNLVFNDYGAYNSSSLVIAAILFAFQIYGDFSGYTDIAIGTARLFGFNLKQNFAYPYFSRDIAEFWRRWHISLSTWFRDYVYIPLGGSKVSQQKVIRNIFIVFIVSGFWHGANWTFILWGALNAIYFVPLLLLNKNRKHIKIVAQGKWFPTIRETVGILLTFALTVFAWIFFRAESVAHAFNFIASIGTEGIFNFPELLPKKIVPLVVLFLLIEWLGRERLYSFAIIDVVKTVVGRWVIYMVLIGCIVYFKASPQQFIYFQF